MEKMIVNDNQQVYTMEGLSWDPAFYQELKDSNERKLDIYIKKTRQPILNIKIETKATFCALRLGTDSFMDYLKQALLNKLFKTIDEHGFLNENFYIEDIAFGEDDDTHKDVGIAMLHVSTKVYPKM